MDADAVELRLRKVEKFLDSEAPGWRDEARWRGRRGADDRPAGAELVVDEEQTRRDRIALGLDRAEPEEGVEDLGGGGGGAPQEQQEEIGSTWTDGDGVAWTKTGDNEWRSGAAETEVVFSGSYRELIARPTTAV